MVPARAGSVVVPFAVPAEVAFDYLSDTAHRPEWQWSLRAVEVPDVGAVVPGDWWYDVTRVPGIRPRMELTRFERPRAWHESGRWGAFSADLGLAFAPTARGCLVRAELRVRGLGAGPVLTRLGGLAVRDDLRRAARILGGCPPGPRAAREGRRPRRG
jgi:hypothetical protein